MSVMQKLLGNTHWTTYTGRLHVGIDLLTNPPMLTLVDDADCRVQQQRRLPERPAQLIAQLKGASGAIADIVVLAKGDGYDLVDRIAEAGLTVYLLTPAQLERYSGIRNLYENHDAYWIAHLLRAGALPVGEVYSARDMHDSSVDPRYNQGSMTPLASRLQVKQPRVAELGGNRRFFNRRKR